MGPELDQLHQICSIIITITRSNLSIALQLLCAKNCKLQLFFKLVINYKSGLQTYFKRIWWMIPKVVPGQDSH